MTCLSWGAPRESMVFATGSQLTMAAPELVKIVPSPAAVVRDTVAVSDLPSSIGRAFGAAVAAAAGQGLELVGAPFAFHPRAPSDVVEGPPVSGSQPRSSRGCCRALELPGGHAATIVHVGPYDRMEKTYEQVRVWMTVQGFTDHLREVDLSDASTEPDPSPWRTDLLASGPLAYHLPGSFPAQGVRRVAT